MNFWNWCVILNALIRAFAIGDIRENSGVLAELIQIRIVLRIVGLCRWFSQHSIFSWLPLTLALWVRAPFWIHLLAREEHAQVGAIKVSRVFVIFLGQDVWSIWIEVGLWLADREMLARVGLRVRISVRGNQGIRLIVHICGLCGGSDLYFCSLCVSEWIKYINIK